MEKLRYPIGKFSKPANFTKELREEFIEILKNAPREYAELIESLSNHELNTPYREDGWTPKQIIHHVADSHMNSFIRIKLALTEDHPTIRPYDEHAWSTLADSTIDVQSSLKILEGVHERYVYLLKSLKVQDFERTLYHPENKESMNIDTLLALYAWHSRHHLAHIMLVKEGQ